MADEKKRIIQYSEVTATTSEDFMLIDSVNGGTHRIKVNTVTPVKDVTVDNASVVSNGVAQINLDGKQDLLTPGANINITSQNVISATDTTYTAGTNVSISSQNVISATDTTYSDFDGTNSGLVPEPGSGDVDKFLKSDGTWGTPAQGQFVEDVTVTPIISTGTHIADIEVDGVTEELYAPDPGPTYTAGSNITITNDVISAVVPDAVLDVKVNNQSVVDVNKTAQIKSYETCTLEEYNAKPATKYSDGILYAITNASGITTTCCQIQQSAYEQLSTAEKSNGVVYFVTASAGSSNKIYYMNTQYGDIGSLQAGTNIDITSGVISTDFSDFAGSSHGLVPAATSGDSGKYLKGDGTWGTPATGSSSLANLTDVNVTSPGNGQLLRYNNTTAKWENQTAGIVLLASPTSDVFDVGNVVLSQSVDNFAVLLFEVKYSTGGGSYIDFPSAVYPVSVFKTQTTQCYIAYTQVGYCDIKYVDTTTIQVLRNGGHYLGNVYGVKY